MGSNFSFLKATVSSISKVQNNIHHEQHENCYTCSSAQQRSHVLNRFKMSMKGIMTCYILIMYSTMTYINWNLNYNADYETITDLYLECCELNIIYFYSFLPRYKLKCSINNSYVRQTCLLKCQFCRDAYNLRVRSSSHFWHIIKVSKGDFCRW